MAKVNLFAIPVESDTQESINDNNDMFAKDISLRNVVESRKVTVLIDQPENSNNSSKAQAHMNVICCKLPRVAVLWRWATCLPMVADLSIAFFLARLLGAEDYGVYTLAISAAAIVSGISTLGITFNHGALCGYAG